MPHDARSYCYDHRAQIDSEIAEQTDLDATMRKYPPTLLAAPDDDD